MLKQTIKFKGLDGQVRERDFYFHIKKDVLVELEIIHNGGFRQHLQDIIDSKNGRKIMDEFKAIVAMAYGEKSEDGLSFLQSKERSEWFMGTDAYSEFFFRLVTEANFAAEFINGIMPDDLEAEAARMEAKMKQAGVNTVPDPSRDTTGAAVMQLPSPTELAAMNPDELEATLAKIRAGQLTQA